MNASGEDLLISLVIKKGGGMKKVFLFLLLSITSVVFAGKHHRRFYNNHRARIKIEIKFKSGNGFNTNYKVVKLDPGHGKDVDFDYDRKIEDIKINYSDCVADDNTCKDNYNSECYIKKSRIKKINKNNPKIIFDGLYHNRYRLVSNDPEGYIMD